MTKMMTLKNLKIGDKFKESKYSNDSHIKIRPFSDGHYKIVSVIACSSVTCAVKASDHFCVFSLSKEVYVNDF